MSMHPNDPSHRRTVVIGGGVVGLRTAQLLADAGRLVTLVDSAPALGGLASGWSVDTPRGPVTWDRFYHVVLSSDGRVRRLLDELDVQIHWRTVSSEMLSDNVVMPMSSVLDLLRLPVLRPLDRLRVGVTVLGGGLLPLTNRTDGVTAAKWLRRMSGARAYSDLWQPMLRAKLGVMENAASAVFIRSTFQRLLWARLRGASGDRFGWIEGGYAEVLRIWSDALRKAGVEIRLSTTVDSIRRADGRWDVSLSGECVHFDEVVLCTAGPAAAQFAKQTNQGALPEAWKTLDKIPYLGCVCAFLVLRRAVTGAYLTYVRDAAPYTAIVEMTNLVDPEAVGGSHVVYLPYYTHPQDPIFARDPGEIATTFAADLIDRYPGLVPDDVVSSDTSKAKYVMPVPVPGALSRPIPPRSGLAGLYLASSAQILNGTLNVESSLQISEAAVACILGDTSGERRRL